MMRLSSQKVLINRFWSGLLVAAGILYVLHGPRFYVGHFSDDARDILAAKSLLAGRYANLQRYNHPPANFPLPGFPLFLAPFVALFEPHWACLKIVPFLGALLSCFLLRQVCQPWLSPAQGLLIGGLYAFNPTTLYLSGNVVSDVWFLSFVLLSCLWSQRILNHARLWEKGAFGLLLGWIAWTRPEGILWIVSLTVALIYTKRWRVLGQTMLLALGLWTLPWIRNYYVTGNLTGYQHLWRSSLPYLSSGYGPLFQNTFQVFQTLFIQNLLALDFANPSRWMIAFDVLCVAMGIVLVILGIRSLERSHPPFLLVSTTLFCLFYGLLHSAWLAVHAHYFFPIVPWVLIYGVRGAQVLYSRFPSLRPAARGACALLLMIYFYQDGSALSQSWGPRKESSPLASFQWIREHVPASPQTLILAANASALCLYTGHYTVALIPSPDMEGFRYRLIKDGVTHIFFAPFHVLAVQTTPDRDPEKMWQRSRWWVRSWPKAFKKIYENPTESTSLYEVVPHPTYRKAYELYLEAMKDLRIGSGGPGLAKLEQTLQVYPHLATALTAYGTALFLAGRDLPLAERTLKEALRIRPTSPLPLLNLARLYRHEGRRDLAKLYYQKAQKAMALSREEE